MPDWDLIELLGYAAAGMVLATFSVRSMTALRSMAIASKLLFIAYAALAHLQPVLLLHALLLPLNLLRLHQALGSMRDSCKKCLWRPSRGRRELSKR